MYIDERNFVKTASQQLEALEQTWATPNDGCFSKNETATRQALEQIKLSANTVQARGVYRAATLCEDVMARTGNECLAKLSSAMTSLKHLVNQYKDGLLEIDPDFNWRSPSIEQEPINLDDPIVVKSEDLETAHTQASQQLSSLMKLVRDPGQKKALSFLMMPIDVDSRQTEIVENSTVSFDALMHPLNNLILGEARHSGKSVSISYAADFVRVNKTHSEHLRNLLEVACLNIVANGIVAGAPGSVSQISITAQDKSDNLYFLISWRGNELSRADRQKPHFNMAIGKLEQAGGHAKYNSSILADTGKARHTLSLIWPLVDINASVAHKIKSNDLTAVGGM